MYIATTEYHEFVETNVVNNLLPRPKGRGI